MEYEYVVELIFSDMDNKQMCLFISEHLPFSGHF